MSFKTVNYLLFEKQQPELDSELLEEFSPFLTAKSLTFVGKGEFSDYVNDTLNVYGNLFPNKEETFKFFDNVIPRQKKTKINYLKKPKVEKVEEEVIPEFYSKREFDIFKRMSKYEHE
jgi:hypothetical protein